MMAVFGYKIQVSYIRIPEFGALAGMQLQSTVRFPDNISASLWLTDVSGHPEITNCKIEKIVQPVT